jgi:hypothetical protein
MAMSLSNEIRALILGGHANPAICGHLKSGHRELTPRYLRAAGIAARSSGRWGHPPPNAAIEVSTDSAAAANAAVETSTDLAWPRAPGNSNVEDWQVTLRRLEKRTFV